MSKKEKTHFKDCNSCGKQQGFGSKYSLARAIRNNSVCQSCTHKGVPKSPEHVAKVLVNLKAYNTSLKDSNNALYGEKFQISKNLCRNWSVAVKTRDNYTCNCCSKKETGSHIHAHHVAPKEYFPETALDVSNGITLCASCHKNLHMDLDKMSLSGIKLTPIGFKEHAERFIAEGKASSQTTQTPPVYKRVFTPLVTIVKE